MLNCIGFIKNWMFLTVSGVYLCSISMSPDLCSLPTCGLCCPAEGCKAMVCWAVCWYGKGTLFLFPPFVMDWPEGVVVVVLHIHNTGLNLIQRSRSTWLGRSLWKGDSVRLFGYQPALKVKTKPLHNRRALLVLPFSRQIQTKCLLYCLPEEEFPASFPSHKLPARVWL